MVAQSSSYDNDNFEIGSEESEIEISTQEGVIKMPVIQQVEQILAMIHGITWLLPMGMV